MAAVRCVWGCTAARLGPCVAAAGWHAPVDRRPAIFWRNAAGRDFPARFDPLTNTDLPHIPSYPYTLPRPALPMPLLHTEA